MKTILVLTDYSYSSFNAARYALAFAGAFEASKVLLYNSYNPAESADELSTNESGLKSVKDAYSARMADLQISLEPFAKRGTRIECFTDSRPLALGVSGICSTFKVDLVIAGGKNRSAMGMLLIGSRIMDVVNKVDIPFLVIPSAYIYEPVMCAVLATDLEDFERLPRTLINRMINDYRCKLKILNVNSHQYEHAATEKILAIGRLHDLMDENHPDYHYTRSSDISKGIREFCSQQHAGLLIVVHKEHGLIHRLFYRSLEREMAMHSDVPVLIVKQAIRELI